MLRYWQSLSSGRHTGAKLLIHLSVYFYLCFHFFLTPFLSQAELLKVELLLLTQIIVHLLPANVPWKILKHHFPQFCHNFHLSKVVHTFFFFLTNTCLTSAVWINSTPYCLQVCFTPITKSLLFSSFARLETEKVSNSNELKLCWISFKVFCLNVQLFEMTE